jgi:hypothetical protein
MKNKQQIFVGLMGPRGAGKDAVGRYLAKQHKFTKIAFADAIRQEAGAAWGISCLNFLVRRLKDEPTRWFSVNRCRDQVFVRWFKAAHPGDQMALWRPRSPRWVMQQWGAFRVDMESPDYWIAQVRKRLKSIPTSIVFTDVRTPEEVAFINGLSEETVFIHLDPKFPEYRSSETTIDARTDAPIWSRAAVGLMRNGLWTVYNDRGVDDLCKIVEMRLFNTD